MLCELNDESQRNVQFPVRGIIIIVRSIFSNLVHDSLI
jgi:hypothetical protein